MEKTRLCKCTIIHEETIKKVLENMPETEKLFDVAEFFSVFGDSTRIGILYGLSQSEMCVCDISSLLNMSQSAISHQLSILKKSRLVRYKRKGKMIFYMLDDEHINEILKLGLAHNWEKF